MSHEPPPPTLGPVAKDTPGAGQTRGYWRGWAMLCRALAEMEWERGRGHMAAGLHLRANHYQRQAGAAHAAGTELSDRS